MNAQDLYDVTIIGAGPAGLYSAFYAGLREMKTKIIEYHSFLGGKVNVYPEKLIWDVGGLTPVTGEQLIRQLIKQGTTFDPTIVLNEKVVSIDKEGDIFTLHTGSGQIHYSKTVIIAIGSGIVKPIKLQLDGAEKFEVTNLHYTVKSLARFHNKTILISGGGNSALDWANELSDVAKKVYLTYRKDALKGHEATITKIKKNGVVCLLNTEIERLIASDDHSVIERVVLRNHEENAVSELNVDEVIVCHGFEHEKELIKNSKVDIRMRDEYCIDGTPLSETSVPGIFAAGDILKHDGKLFLIAGAFQDAANAVNRAKQYISPDATSYGMVSSHNDRFNEKNKELKKLMFK
ncbi:NAD(P)/FAD-dependent oxidoreductase [Brevibacillus thermoruber]|jgi:ferredoxin/flavodoxin---NADP+ reductase|uniref:NAD(P)/FAD-dependent oxidoreductase n=1 Tax=Brevibacillus thermoruber TaxID=33942 RepID=UPI0003FB8725|nr:NAD(P)/FAD-dependent oxidoreductase [Brevibacillus thermoruber]